MLLFSRNDTGKALDLISEMYDFVDEIVLFDSSAKKLHEELFSEKAKLGLRKLKIYYVAPLGYLEPALMYALSKCRQDWVLLLGTDERISADFKSGLRKLIDNAECAAFSMKRYEDVAKGKRGAYANWQIRLFRKGSVTFRGIIHEEPTVKGSLVKLDGSRYFIDHVNELKGRSGIQYSIMEKFLRMSYWSFNERIIENFYKITMPGRRNSPGSLGLGLKTILLVYEKLGNKHQEEEISDLDYFIFYYLYYLSVNIKAHNKGSLSAAFGSAKHMLGMAKEWQNEPDGMENFEISKKLYRMGLIKFLGLDRESTVLRINKRYEGGKGGINLLISLLKLRNEKGKKWLG